MKVFFLIFICLLSNLLIAQSISDSVRIEQNHSFTESRLGEDLIYIETPVKKGSLVCNMDDTVLNLIHFYNDQNKSNGYKVQLFSGRSRLDATKIKSEFNSKYPNELSSVIIYQQPNYKLRAGNFRDRLTALKYLELLKIEFPSAFIVRDEIQVDL